MKLRFAASLFCGGALALVATASHATTIYTSNLSSGSSSSGSAGGYQLDYNGTITGVTTTGYNFVFTNAAAAVATGANGEYGTVALASVTANTLDTQDGGAFLAMDGDFDTSAVDFAINTVAGQTYTVMFDWAATQQTAFSGATTDSLAVALGGDVAQDTSTLSIGSQGFSGWDAVTDTFVAGTTGTEELSFLAQGTGEPPFALLDDIDVSTPSAAPEPSSLMLLGTGLAALGGFVRMRLKKNA